MNTVMFPDKSKAPTASDLKNALGDNHTSWIGIKNYALSKHHEANEMWNYSKTFGWSARIKDAKRVIVYLMPQDKFFKASFVLGAKASAEALASDLPEDIKEIIKSAKVYAEGRGFRIEVKDKKIIKHIKKLIDIKLSS